MDRFNTPGTLATAQELVTLKEGSMINALIANVIEAAKNQLRAPNPNLRGPLDEVAAELRQEYERKRAEILELVTKLWAAYFTEQELTDIFAFYKTPSGKMMLVQEPRVIDTGQAVVQYWTNFSDLVLQRFRTEMQKKGYKP
jgi:hypothetical protein